MWGFKLRKIAFLIALSVLLSQPFFPSVSISQESCGWPCFMANPQHTGTTPDECAPKKDVLDVLWTYEAKTPIASSAAVVDGKVYFGTSMGVFYCLDAMTGAKVWEAKLPGAIVSSPAIDGDKVYFGCNDRRFYCMNAATGGTKWAFSCSDSINSSATVADGKAYFGSYNWLFYCLDAATGEKLWTYQFDAPVTNCAAVSGDKVVVGSLEKKFICFEAQTGKPVWQAIKIWGASSPVISDGKIYLSSGSDFYCIKLDDGSVVWQKPYPSKTRTSPAIHNGFVYLASDEELLCVHAETGEAVWSKKMAVTSSVIYSKNRLFLASNNRFVFIDAANGNEIWAFKSKRDFNTTPALWGTRIYIGCDDGNMYCLGDQPPRAATIELSPQNPTVEIPNTVQFSAKVFDQYGNAMDGEKIVFSATQDRLGKIDANGLFTPVAPGSCEVVASCGKAIAKTIVTITKKDVPPTPSCKVKVTPDSLSFGKILRGKSHYLTFKIEFEADSEQSGTITPSEQWIEVSPRSFKTMGKAVSGTVTIKASTLPQGESFEGEIVIKTKDGLCGETRVKVTVATDYDIVLKLTVGNNVAFINSDKVELDVPPMIIAGRTLVPIRFISESFGCKVEWEAQTGKITISRNDFSIVLFRDKREAIVNGEPKQLDVAASIIQGRTLVPVRFISEGFGANVEWDAATRGITVTWAPF